METKNAWAAGIVDGEGYIAIERYKTVRCIVRVDNTDKRLLLELQKCFGGTIHINTRKNRPTHKPCWFWYICAKQSLYDFLNNIVPYLIIKKDKAIEVMNYLNQN